MMCVSLWHSKTLHVHIMLSRKKVTWRTICGKSQMTQRERYDTYIPPVFYGGPPMHCSTVWLYVLVTYYAVKYRVLANVIWQIWHVTNVGNRLLFLSTKNVCIKNRFPCLEASSHQHVDSNGIMQGTQDND